MEKLVICVAQESSSLVCHLMAQAFDEGWETLERLSYSKCCGHYCTTLYRPIPAPKNLEATAVT